MVVFASSSLPVNLYPEGSRDFFVATANQRLANAREKGVLLKDLFIDGDGLVAWPSMSWSPATLDDLVVIQEQLAVMTMTENRSRYLHRLLVAKGSERLQEARDAQMSIEDVWVGSGLLLEWVEPAPDADSQKSSD